MQLSRFIVLAALIVLTGCGASGGSGMAAASDSTDPALPPVTCPAGTMPKLLEAACVSVGTTACAAGFEADGSGWGCTAVVPATACGHDTRARLGDRACVAVDDCSAAFPPAGATVVTASGAMTLAAALTAARPGATIAVDEGTYELAAVLENDLTIVGRCASKVKLHATKGSVLLVGSGANVEARSVSISAPLSSAVYAIEKGHAVLSHVVIAESVSGVGASRLGTVRVTSSLVLGNIPGVADPATTGAAGAYAMHGGVVTLEDTEIRGYAMALASYHVGTEIQVERSVVGYDAAPENPIEPVVFAASGGGISLTESQLATPRRVLIAITENLSGDTAHGTGTHLRVTRSELTQAGVTAPLPATILVDGGRLTLEDSTLVNESDAAVRALNQATVNLAHVVVRVGPVRGNEHAALHVLVGASATVATSAIVSPVQYGIIAAGAGAHLDLTDSLVTGTEYRPSFAEGTMPGCALGVSVNAGATATLGGSTIHGSAQYGLHASLGAQVVATGVLVDGTRAPDDGTPGGVGVTVDETGRLAMVGSAVRGSLDAAFAFRSGGNVVGETAIVGNALVLRLVNVPLSQLGAAPAGLVDDAVVFYDNRVHANAAFMSAEVPPAVEAPPFKTTP